MNRTHIPSLLVCAALLWPANPASRADEKASGKAANWEEITFGTRGGKQEPIMVLRLWNSAASDPKWPQLALLRMSPAVYKELRGNKAELKEFIDGTKTGKLIFDAPVTITKRCRLPEPEDADVEADVSWLLLISHRMSHASCTALAEHSIPTAKK